MKDKILKLCRRMRNATKTDLLQIAEIEPNVLETVLMYLLDEKLLEEKNGCYFPIDKKELTEIPRIELRSLPLMIQCHSPETIDLIIRGFCEKIGCQKMCNIANVSTSTITAFYNEFRKLIYERQNNNLLNNYFINHKYHPHLLVYYISKVFLPQDKRKKSRKQINCLLNFYFLFYSSEPKSISKRTFSRAAAA